MNEGVKKACALCSIVDDKGVAKTCPSCGEATWLALADTAPPLLVASVVEPEPEPVRKKKR